VGGLNLPFGSKCRNCGKIVREHTKQIYVHGKDRGHSGVMTFTNSDTKQECHATYIKGEKYVNATIGKYYTSCFCSDKCKNESHKKKRDIANKNARNKNKIRPHIINRDKGCIFCTSGYYWNLSNIPNNRLELHRVVSGENGGDYLTNNVVLVCMEHHLILSNKSNSLVDKWGSGWGSGLNPVFVKHKDSMTNFIDNLALEGWLDVP